MCPPKWKKIYYVYVFWRPALKKIAANLRNHRERQKKIYKAPRKREGRGENKRERKRKRKERESVKKAKRKGREKI
jgi:hypothetical protein